MQTVGSVHAAFPAESVWVRVTSVNLSHYMAGFWVWAALAAVPFRDIAAMCPTVIPISEVLFVAWRVLMHPLLSIVIRLLVLHPHLVELLLLLSVDHVVAILLLF